MDKAKTMEQLIKELNDMREQLARLEKAESDLKTRVESLGNSEEQYKIW